MFTTKTRFELESNPTIFVKNGLWMKEIWPAKVAVIKNVEFQHAAPLGIKVNPPMSVMISFETHLGLRTILQAFFEGRQKGCRPPLIDNSILQQSMILL